MDAVPFYFSPAKVCATGLESCRIRYHVKRYAAYMDGNPLWEIDIPGRKYIVNGVDYSKKRKLLWKIRKLLCKWP